MKCTEVVVINKLGMHARASAKLVSLASSFASTITVTRDGRSVNGKSIMGIMMLAAGPGSTLRICADGADEAEASGALCRLIEQRFGEDA
ncbi:HPr family phosphocarrier protein [Acidiferrobacter sp.]|uniref:HPr family phosphocarrier protein n=1 Tax=Acidiferrobacter sp. TaxID=1872107 RepID=UPI002632667E|nr:HPr family phosphocarrier protein [Acidiferrobacter sp.]